MPTTSSQFETLLYRTDGSVATITLNRPEHLNTIVPPMPDEIEKAIGVAERDPAIKVIVLRGAGRAFSGGYDFGGGFHHWGDAMNTDGRWDPGKDFAMVSARETGPTQKFMAIWRASKPVIAQVHGWCVGGASDYALCADIVIASDDAVIGTPYARMWGASPVLPKWPASSRTSRYPNCRPRSSSSIRPTRTWAWPPPRRSAASWTG
jgi:enoyl-CoA hydratase